MALLVAILGLAALDSLNPASIAIAAYLRLAGRGRDLTGFVAAAFGCYLAVALVLTLGVGPQVRTALGDAPATVTSGVQILVGALLLAIGLRIWRARQDGTAHPERGRRSGFALGVGATLIDLPTSAPLIVASGLIVAERPGAAAATGLLTVYVAACVGPLLAIALWPRRRSTARSPVLHRTATALARCTPALVAALCVGLGSVLGGQGVVALA